MNLFNKKLLYELVIKDSSLNNNEKKFVIEGVISTAINTIIAGVFITGYVFSLGGTEATAGIAASVPLFASIFQVFFVKIWSYVSDKKKFINYLTLMARYIIIMAFFLSAIICVDKKIRITIFFFLLFLGYIIGTMSGLEFNNWLVSMIKRERRGEFYSTKFRKVLICGTIVGLAASKCLDYFNLIHVQHFGFMLIISAAGILSIADYNVIKRIDYVQNTAVSKENVLSKKNLVFMLKDKTFLHIVIYMCMWSFLVNITNPYYNVYMLKNLHLSYFSIMIFSIFQVIISVLIIKFWGRMANNTSWINIFIIATLSYGIQNFIWFFVTKNTIFFIVIIYVISGLTTSGQNMASFNLPYSYIPKDMKTLYISFITSINSTMGFLGTLVGSMILNFSKLCKFNFLSTNGIRLNIIITFILLIFNVFYGKHFIPQEK